MIQLDYVNGEVYVFDTDDWITLRTVHRIVGEETELDKKVPCLPVRLLPEEVLLLLDKNLAKVVESKYEHTEETNKIYRQQEKELLAHQQAVYKENRRKQLESMIDKIYEGKRKKGDTKTKEEMLNEELEKSSSVTKRKVVSPTLLKPLFRPSECKEICRDVIFSKTTELRSRVYKDLWEKSYYIVFSNNNADFILYLEDPISDHGQVIVRCMDDEEEIMPNEITALTRFAKAEEWNVTLASLEDDKVDYITIPTEGCDFN